MEVCLIGNFPMIFIVFLHSLGRGALLATFYKGMKAVGVYMFHQERVSGGRLIAYKSWLL